MNTKTTLLNNSRFYILVVSVLLSVIVISYIRLNIPGDQLFYIRSQQLFGLLAMMYWFVALSISPVAYVLKKPFILRLAFARRAIGVSAAYFALLHGIIALWGQLGGLSELKLLPSLFQLSIAGGALGLLILLVMAATSFDRVVAAMTYKKWKLLHRLVYGGFIVVCLHIWTIGTHLAYSGVQWTAFIALVVLCGLEIYRIISRINDKHRYFDTTEKITLFVSVWVVIVALIACTPLVIQNYHSQHTDHENSTQHSKTETHDD
jgi:DMSO/TMAO reductase YedYZ heme-binding membrane subunit